MSERERVRESDGVRESEGVCTVSQVIRAPPGPSATNVDDIEQRITRM